MKDSPSGALQGMSSTTFADSPSVRALPGPAVIVLIILGAFIPSTFDGPALGDHEAIVALCARDMVRTEDWVVPRFLDTTFARKTPLPYWAVAAVSLPLAPDAGTGLPVSTSSARMPSALAAVATSLVLWRLAAGMFGSQAGRLAALISASSGFMLLFAGNATAEMLLVLGCTWSFAHFWWAYVAPTRSQRHLHLARFYLALGFAMLAKGPAPVALVVIPLAAWWFTHRPLRLLATGAPGRFRRALSRGVREAPLRAWRGVSRLHVLPGLVLCGVTFVPWMIAVVRRDPSAWHLWDWQYLQRAEGDFQDTRHRGLLYYLPIAIGALAPWLIFLPEALAAPWLKRYARLRQPLLFAGTWAVTGIAVMSLMEFKKPYYILPALPGLILLISAVLDRMISLSPHRSTFARNGSLLLAALAIGFAIGGRELLPAETGVASTTLAMLGAAYLLVLAGSAALYSKGRARGGMVLAALGALLLYQAGWHGLKREIDRIDHMNSIGRLNDVLDQMQVPHDETIYWADQRPDARLSFYYNRRATYLLPPVDIVARMVDRTGMSDQIAHMALERAREVLKQPEPRYLIVSRENYELWKDQIGHVARIMIVSDPSRPMSKHDWVVITNQCPSGTGEAGGKL